MNASRVARWCIALFVAAVALCTGLLFGRYNGDSLLYLPFAQNAARGDFFAYIPHVFSSGSTSALWPIVLAVVYVINGGEVAAQIIAIVVLCAALWDTYRTALHITRSPLAAAVALVAVGYMLTLPGLLMYESAAMILCINLLLRETVAITKTVEASSRRFLPLSIAWMLLPLMRPDCALLVALDAAAIVWFLRKTDRRMQWKIVLMLVVSMIPSAAYYGYSYVATGFPSVSAASRAFAFREGTHMLYNTWWSPAIPLYVLKYPSIIWFGLAAFGGWKALRGDGEKTFARLALGAVVLFLLIVTVVVPVTASPWRYLLPVMPFVGVFAGEGVRGLMALRMKYATCLLIACVIAAMIVPCAMLVRNGVRERSMGHTYDNATDVTLAEYLNAHAPQNAVLLAYDVQVKLRLRPDLQTLDLDGVTDGKVLSYISDITAFLRRYRPMYLATNVAFVRPYLASSIVGAVAQSSDETIGSVIERDGIRFTLLQTHRLPDLPEIGSWQRLYEIAYLR